MWRLRRLSSLGPRGLADLLLLTVLAAIAEAGVRTRPLPSVAARFGLRLTGAATPPSSWQIAPRQRQRMACVEMLLRHWPFIDPDAACLRRALLLGWVFRDRDPLLRIGVARGEDGVTAHAWIEFDGRQMGGAAGHVPMPFQGL